MELTKRQKIVVASVIMALGLLLTATINFFFLRYRLVFGLGLLAVSVSVWALWEGLTKLKIGILMILPLMFTVGVASFYFLLPFRWLTRLPVVFAFGLSFYFLLLAENVFNVASFRTIPLYRAASTVNFLFILITAFFLFNVVYAFNLPFYWNFISVSVISFPLILQSLWTIEMDTVSAAILIYSAILAVIVGEVAMGFSFWPIAPTMWSLSLATVIYILVGLVTEIFKDKLKKRVVGEYIGIGLVVFLFTLLTTSWGG